MLTGCFLFDVGEDGQSLTIEHRLSLSSECVLLLWLKKIIIAIINIIKRTIYHQKNHFLSKVPIIIRICGFLGWRPLCGQCVWLATNLWWFHIFLSKENWELRTFSLWISHFQPEGTELEPNPEWNWEVILYFLFLNRIFGSLIHKGNRPESEYFETFLA